MIHILASIILSHAATIITTIRCFLLGYRLKGTIFARISRLIRLLAIEQPQFTLDARISLVSVGSSSPLPFHPLVRVHVEAAS